MLEILKLENGLAWNGVEKHFTPNVYENGYEIIDDNYISIELNDQVYCLGASEVIIDGYTPTSSQDLIDTIFNA